MANFLGKRRQFKLWFVDTKWLARGPGREWIHRQQNFFLPHMLTGSEDCWFPIQIVLEIKQTQREAYLSHLLNYRTVQYHLTKLASHCGAKLTTGLDIPLL